MIERIIWFGAHPAVEMAARELERILRAMDAEADICMEKASGYDASRKNALQVGLDPALAAFVPPVKDAEADDAICVRVKGGNGFVTGSNPRSVLIAAYRLLSENGVKFVRPGENGEVIPRAAVSGLSADVCEKPSCRHRGVCIEGSIAYHHARDIIDWLPKVGLNAYFIQFFRPRTFFDRWYDSRNPYRAKQEFTREDADGVRDALSEEITRRGLMFHCVGHGWTCEPFGIEGDSWEDRHYEVPDGVSDMFAEVNGKRELWGGIPLNTNLCYGNPAVREKVVRAVADYAAEHGAVEYLHIWLADDSNNHCQCPLCRDTLPSDLYVKLLNEIDAELTRRGLPTKIVFLLYVDLLWAPEKERLAHPERFVMMFAPITRIYMKPFLPGAPFDGTLAPYKRNENVMPRTVAENVERLKTWQDVFTGDGFDYDYHLNWGNFLCVGYYHLSEVLAKDMANLRALGLNGMISCQMQRVFMPASLPMQAMAASLWDNDADFETVARRACEDAFGEDGPAAQEFLRGLSERGYIGEEEKLAINEAAALRLASVSPFVDGFMPTIACNMQKDLPYAQARSWRMLAAYAELTRGVSDALCLYARGGKAAARAKIDETVDLAWKTEMEFPEEFDGMSFTGALKRGIAAKE